MVKNFDHACMLYMKGKQEKTDHAHVHKGQCRRKSSHLAEKAWKSFASRMFAGSDLHIEAPVKLNDL